MPAAIALVSFLLLLPFAATAKTITVRGEGFATCASWIQEHDTKSSRQPVQDSWLLGYVNGVSSTLEIPGIDDASARFRNADLVTWINDYCSAHQDEPIIRAADALMRDLARQVGKAN
jgi:hypothetical protein